MKNVAAFIAIVVIGFFVTQIGPWYSVAISGFIGGLLIRNQWRALGIGFLAGFVLWFGDLWMLQNDSPSDLPERMAQLIGVSSGFILTLVSSVVGGLVTGLGAAAGGALLQPKKDNRSRRSRRRFK